MSAGERVAMRRAPKDMLSGRAFATEGNKERPCRRRATSDEHGSWGERIIAGVPARFMAPRIVFLVCLVALVLFGLVMVYSASMVTALKEEGDAQYYLVRQLRFVLIGAVPAVMIATGKPFQVLRWRWLLVALWLVLTALLVAVKVGGAGSGGATRWINLGFFALQPSEFSKPLLIMVLAQLFEMRYQEGMLQDVLLAGSKHSLTVFHALCLAAVGIQLALILGQPDYGTTMIITVTLISMMGLSGMPLKYVGIACLFVVIGGLVGFAVEPYRMQRVLNFGNAMSDTYGDTYQMAMAVFAFASGGLFGRGIGGSIMKYSYLPEAHNDYIFAVIGEEVGLVGTAVFVAVFVALVISAMMISKRSPTMQGRLVAGGCSVLLGVQFLINTLGVLDAAPMTGKPLPYISYGGSSIISCLILAGLVIRVSVESAAATEHDVRRGSLSVLGSRPAAMTEQDDVSSHLGRSTAGTPYRRGASPAERGFSVFDGGASSAPRRPVDPTGRPRTASRREASGAPYERVNLGGDTPGDRLRTDGPRRRGEGSGYGRGSSRYDR